MLMPVDSLANWCWHRSTIRRGSWTLELVGYRPLGPAAVAEADDELTPILLGTGIWAIEFGAGAYLFPDIRTKQLC
jgi:hypothetical protein